MVIAGEITGDGAEIIVRKECANFFIVVMGVYNYYCLAFVSSGDHGIAVGDFLVYLL